MTAKPINTDFGAAFPATFSPAEYTAGATVALEDKVAVARVDTSAILEVTNAEIVVVSSPATEV